VREGLAPEKKKKMKGEKKNLQQFVREGLAPERSVKVLAVGLKVLVDIRSSLLRC
jgi:hypothetical protein